MRVHIDLDFISVFYLAWTLSKISECQIYSGMVLLFSTVRDRMEELGKNAKRRGLNLPQTPDGNCPGTASLEQHERPV